MLPIIAEEGDAAELDSECKGEQRHFWAFEGRLVTSGVIKEVLVNTVSY